MGRRKKAHTDKILRDLNSLDPGLDKKSPEIRKTVEKMIELRPDVKLSGDFREELRKKIFTSEQKENKIIRLFSPGRMMLAASIFSALLVIVFLPALLLTEKNKSYSEREVSANLVQKAESPEEDFEMQPGTVHEESSDTLSAGRSSGTEISREENRDSSGLKQESTEYRGFETASKELPENERETAGAYSSHSIEKKDPSESEITDEDQAELLLANNGLLSETDEAENGKISSPDSSDTRHIDTIGDEEYEMMDRLMIAEGSSSRGKDETSGEIVRASEDDTVSSDIPEESSVETLSSTLKESGGELSIFPEIREYLESGELPPENFLENYSIFSLFKEYISEKAVDYIYYDYYSSAAVSPYDPGTAYLLVYMDYPEIIKSRIEISYNRDVIYTVWTAADPEIDVALSSDRFPVTINEKIDGKHFLVTRLKLTDNYNDISGISDIESAEISVSYTDNLNKDYTEVYKIKIDSSMNNIMSDAVPLYMWFELISNPDTADPADFIDLKKIIEEYPDQSEINVRELSEILDLTISIFQKRE